MFDFISIGACQGMRGGLVGRAGSFAGSGIRATRVGSSRHVRLMRKLMGVHGT